jgi:putative transposase
MRFVEELSHRVGVTAACMALEIPRASFYRRHAWKGAPERSATAVTPDSLPGSGCRSPRALKSEEHQAVLAHLHSERFVDRSPREVYATLLDEGMYLCSVRTLYRILEEHEEVRERRDQRRHPHYRKPELNPPYLPSVSSVRALRSKRYRPGN